MDRKYAGTVLAIGVGFAIDLTAGVIGLHWWYVAGIGVLTVVIAVLLWPREEPVAVPMPEQTHSVVKGNVGANSAFRRTRVRGANHFIEGDMGDGGTVEDLDVK